MNENRKICDIAVSVCCSSIITTAIVHENKLVEFNICRACLIELLCKNEIEEMKQKK